VEWTQLIIAFVTGGAASGIVALYTIKFKVRKIENNTVRDDLKLNDELLGAFDELQKRTSELLKKNSEQEELISQIQTENLALKREIEKLNKDINYYRTQCNCNE
jgi:peptidoglycan hydrolase CwlO-like protein